MYLLDTNKTAAEETLIALSRHLPIGFDLGRPQYATAGGEIVCKDGATSVMFGLDDGGCRVWRMADLVRGLIEYTTWEYGQQTARRIIRRPGDGGGGGRGDDDGPEGGRGPYEGPPGGADDPEFAFVRAWDAAS